MVEYKLVKYCRLCNKRFVTDKKESRRNYCSTCQSKITKEQRRDN